MAIQGRINDLTLTAAGGTDEGDLVLTGPTASTPRHLAGDAQGASQTSGSHLVLSPTIGDVTLLQAELPRENLALGSDPLRTVPTVTERSLGSGVSAGASTVPAAQLVSLSGLLQLQAPEDWPGDLRLGGQPPPRTYLAAEGVVGTAQVSAGLGRTTSVRAAAAGKAAVAGHPQRTRAVQPAVIAGGSAVSGTAVLDLMLRPLLIRAFGEVGGHRTDEYNLAAQSDGRAASTGQFRKTQALDTRRPIHRDGVLVGYVPGVNGTTNVGTFYEGPIWPSETARGWLTRLTLDVGLPSAAIRGVATSVEDARRWLEVAINSRSTVATQPAAFVGFTARIDASSTAIMELRTFLRPSAIGGRSKAIAGMLRDLPMFPFKILGRAGVQADATGNQIHPVLLAGTSRVAVSLKRDRPLQMRARGFATVDYAPNPVHLTSNIAGRALVLEQTEVKIAVTIRGRSFLLHIPSRVDVDVRIQAAATANVRAGAIRGLGSEVTGSGQVTAKMARWLGLVLTNLKYLEATVAARSNLHIQIDLVTHLLQAEVNGTADIAGALPIARPLGSAIDGQATVGDTPMTLRVGLIPQLTTGTASVHSDLDLHRLFKAVSAGLAEQRSALNVRYSLGGASTGVSTVNGMLALYRSLAIQIFGLAQVEAWARRLPGLDAGVAGLAWTQVELNPVLAPVPDPPASPVLIGHDPHGAPELLLEWSDVNAEAYDLYRDGNLIAYGLTELRYVDRTPSQNTSWQVIAYNVAPRRSLGAASNIWRYQPEPTMVAYDDSRTRFTRSSRHLLRPTVTV